MEEEILREILQEMKGFRSDLSETNTRLEHLENNSIETNTRLEHLENNSIETNKRLEGLTSSFVVLQQGFSDMRIDLIEIKKYLSDKVIWNNDSITIDSESGPKLQGVIHKRGKL
jgi:chromosome segregation ATPase